MIIDTNTWVGHWPFQPLKPATPQELMEHLESEGIDRAWTAAADAVLFSDPQIGNERWLPAISQYDRLVPVAVIDPTFGNWRNSLNRCVNEWNARVMKLVPNYRCFALDTPEVDECIVTASEMNLVVSLQVRMEDERRHHPLMKVPPLSAEELLSLSKRHSEMTFHVACAYLRQLRQLDQADNFVFEISSLEQFNTLKAILEIVPAERLCTGSHTPFYYTRSALLKLQSADVPKDTVCQIQEGPKAWVEKIMS